MPFATDHVEDWADGTYRFALHLRQLEELDDKAGVGPAAMLARLLDGTWRLVDVRDTIRLGLIGGGTDAAKALQLVRRYVDAAPLEQAVPLALEILTAAVRGRAAAPEDDEGNGAAAKPLTDPAGSTSPPSDATHASSASHPPISEA